MKCLICNEIATSECIICRCFFCDKHKIEHIKFYAEDLRTAVMKETQHDTTTSN